MKPVRFQRRENEAVTAVEEVAVVVAEVVLVADDTTTQWDDIIAK